LDSLATKGLAAYLIVRLSLKLRIVSGNRVTDLHRSPATPSHPEIAEV
jgi:hypothetical protein